MTGLAASEPSATARSMRGRVWGHDAPRADVHVADLGVSHLPVGQADIGVRRLEQAVRATRPETVPHRRLGERDGIAVGLGAVAPAVEYAQHDGMVAALGVHGTGL